MLTPLLIATKNQGKLKEFHQLLKNTNFKIISLEAFKKIPKNFTVKETGKSFKANAILKATKFGQKSKTLTIADDSGLSIDYLNGQPGIHSSRFAKSDYQTAIKKILKSLTNVPIKNRTAKFVSCLCLYNPSNQTIKTFSGKAHGWITTKPKGTHGFGYDPIFLSKDLNKTFAQLSQSQKNQVSHRARSLKKLKKFLLQLEPSQAQ